MSRKGILSIIGIAIVLLVLLGKVLPLRHSAHQAERTQDPDELKMESVSSRAQERDPSVRAELFNWLDDKNPLHRRVAISALYYFPDQETFLREKQLLSDPDPAIRGLVLSAMASQKVPEAKQAILDDIARSDATLGEKIHGHSSLLALLDRASPQWMKSFQFLLAETADSNPKFASMSGWSLFENAADRPEVRELAIGTLEGRRSGPNRSSIVAYLSRIHDPWLKENFSKLKPEEQEALRKKAS